MNKMLRSALPFTLLLFLQGPNTQAWKPYTHIYTGEQVRKEAITGYVTINNRRYEVKKEIVKALTDWPAFFNAGIVGPDGLPDLLYGQSIIHPHETGLWLRHIYVRAWEAQLDSQYSADEKSQILAFAYGYLAHAAGDMWAHTLVNDFARGVFPSIGEALPSPNREVDKQLLKAQAEIILRHFIVEAYVGDATPGYDGNPDRTTLSDGDLSDDNTPEIKFDAPTRFIFNTLIDPAAATPTLCGNGKDDDRDGVVDDGCPGGKPQEKYSEALVRGPLIDFFLRLRASVRAAREKRKLKITDKELDVVFVQFGRVKGSCSLRTSVTSRQRCKEEWDDFQQLVRQFKPVEMKQSTAYKELLIAAYLRWWGNEIDMGLQAWGDFGLSTTRGLFDPQARRRSQNKECANRGSEEKSTRIRCEKELMRSAVLYLEAEPWLHGRLPSMLGGRGKPATF